VLAVAALVQLVLVAERVLIWTLVALFPAMALNSAVDWLIFGEGVPRDGLEAAWQFGDGGGGHDDAPKRALSYR